MGYPFRTRAGAGIIRRHLEMIMAAQLQRHTCPVCGKEFMGSFRKKFCSQACKQKDHRYITGDCHSQHNDSLQAYRDALQRDWFNPDPWKDTDDENSLYGNTVFL